MPSHISKAHRRLPFLRAAGQTTTVLGLLVVLAVPTLRAGWTPTAVGTYDYLNLDNWGGGPIDDTFPATLTLLGAQTATFGANHTAAAGVSFLYGGAFNVTLRADGAGARTLTLGGDLTVAPVANQTITFGSTTANQNLHIDLGGATRTFSVAAGKTLNVINNVANGDLRLVGGGTVSLSTLANFAGELTVDQNTILSLPGSPVPASCRIGIGASGGTLRMGNTIAHVMGPITASGRLTLGGSNIAVLYLSGANTFADGIDCGSSSLLMVASQENLGGPATPFYGNVKLSVIGDFMTGFEQHALDTVTAVHLETQSPTCVFTVTNALTGTINAAGSPIVQKLGPGTAVLAAPQSYHNVQSTYGTAVVGGTLILDAANGGTLYTAKGGSIALGNGTFVMKGKATGTTAQSVDGVYLDALHHNADYRKSGSSTFVVDDNGGAGTTFNMDTLTVLNSNNHGTSLNIDLVGANAVLTTTSANDATGLLGGGRVTFEGTDWATVGGGGAVGAYAGYTVGLPSSGASAGANYGHTGSASVTASQTANTLKLDTSASGQSLAIAAGQILTLASGSLLFTGADDYTVSGGALNSGTTPVAELLLHHYGDGELAIGSEIVNGTGESHLLKTGPGTVVLTAATNSYTGWTYIHEGVLSVSANSQLGLPTLGKKIFLQGGTLRATETFTLANGTANKRGIGIGSDGGTFDVAAGKNLTVAATVTGVPIGGTTNSRGLGGLRLANSDGGNGVLTLNTGCYFTGGVVIECGVLQMMHSDALNPIGVNTVTFGDGAVATLQTRNANPVIAGLIGANSNAIVENIYGSGVSVLTIANGGDCTFGGVLRNGGAGTLALTKTSRGTQTLTGASTYTGPTTVLSGTLAVNGSLAAASAVSVNGGALGGTGTVAGSVAVNAGGSLAPGASVGTLTTGPLTLAAGATLAYELGTPASSDRTTVVGDLTLDGVLDVTPVAGFGAGQYTLITFTGSLVDQGLEIGSVPDAGLVYSVRTTSNSVVLSAAAPGMIVLVR